MATNSYILIWHHKTFNVPYESYHANFSIMLQNKQELKVGHETDQEVCSKQQIRSFATWIL